MMTIGYFKGPRKLGESRNEDGGVKATERVV